MGKMINWVENTRFPRIVQLSKKMPMDLGRDRKKRTLIESRRKSVPAIHQIALP